MQPASVLVHGTLQPDGTLHLDEKPALPAGPVEVLIRSQPAGGQRAESWWDYLQRARAELVAQGHTFRSPQEIQADRDRSHQENETRRRTLQRLLAPQE